MYSDQLHSPQFGSSMWTMLPILRKGKSRNTYFRSLPNYIRPKGLHRIPGKTFHTSPRYRFLDTCLIETYTLISGLHATTGFSWAVTLPLTALLIRFVLIAPVITYQHLVNRRRLEHQPLIQAWTHVYRDQVMREHAAKGPVACQRLVSTRLMRKSAEIYKRTGTQRWKSFLSYLQIPVWLVAIETIRRMCGAREGLLGVIRNWFYGSQSGDTPPNEQESPSESASSEQISEADDTQTLLPRSIDVLEGTVEGPLIPLDPTLATEGALWFPNLLDPDPHLMLSFILSGSLLANIFYHELKAKKRNWKPGAIQRGFGNGLKTVALAIGPLTLSFPSAIHIYLISSSVFGLANTILLNQLLPIPATSQPRKPEISELGKEQTFIKWESEARQIRKIRRRRQQGKHKV